MDLSQLLTILRISLLFGAACSFSLAENITFVGSASSLSSAKQLCSQNGKTLITAESDEKMSDITNFLQSNNFGDTWLHATFEELPQWRFTDEKGTVLDNHIDTAEGGLCAAISSDENPKFKSYPCRKCLQALKTKSENKTTFYPERNNGYKWYSLNKTLIATPTKNTIKNAAALFTNQIDNEAPREPDYWVGLHKFRFIWPDATEISLRKYTWEDNSKNDGKCLILKDNENLTVVDCNNENNYTVLCIPDHWAAVVESQLKIALYVLGAVFMVLAIISLGIGWYEMQNCKKEKRVHPANGELPGPQLPDEQLPLQEQPLNIYEEVTSTRITPISRGT